jgi:hypothetical protein
MTKTGLEGRRTRAKYACPPELQELIDHANRVPASVQLPDFTLEIQNETGEVSAYSFLMDLLKDFPREFIEFLEREALEYCSPWGLSDQNDPDAFKRHFVNRYIAYRNARNEMLWFVQRLESERELRKRLEKERGAPISYDHFNLWDWEAFPMPAGGFIYRGDDHRLHLSGLAGAIEKGFEDDRLRRCVICSKIFWAPQSKSKTCNRACLNILNVQNYRKRSADEKAALTLRRKNNKRRKKTIELRKSRKPSGSADS